MLIESASPGDLNFNATSTLTIGASNLSTVYTGSIYGAAANILNLNGAQDYATLNANAGATNPGGSFTNGTGCRTTRRRGRSR